jgi:hypothetical protein
MHFEGPANPAPHRSILDGLWDNAEGFCIGAQQPLMGALTNDLTDDATAQVATQSTISR